MKRTMVYHRGKTPMQPCATEPVGYGNDSHRNNGDWWANMASSHRNVRPELLRSWVHGGYKWSGTPLYTDAHRGYHFPSDAWSTYTASGNAQWQASGCCTNRCSHQMGGYTSVSITYHGEYDPYSNAWSTMAALSPGRNGAASLGYPMVPGHTFYFTMGGIASGGTSGCTGTLTQYHRGADAYTARTAQANDARASQGYSVVGRHAIVYNGYNCAGAVNLNETYTYFAGTDAWSSKTAVGTAWREGLHASDWSKKHYTVGYYISGSSGATTAWHYDFGSDSWSNLGNQSLGSAGPNGLVSSSRLMQRGPSADGASKGLTVDLYNFHTNSLTNIADCSTTLSYNWQSNIS